jgi:hypothetical protein
LPKPRSNISLMAATSLALGLRGRDLSLEHG